MLRICPHHGLEPQNVIHTFYDGLSYNTKLNIDAAAGSAIMDKQYEEAYQLIENMAQNHYQWEGERASIEKPKPKGGMYEVSGIDHVNAKVDALTQKIESLTITPAATVVVVTLSYDLCGVPGNNVSECQLLEDITPNQSNHAQGNPHSNTYNPGWKTILTSPIRITTPCMLQINHLLVNKSQLIAHLKSLLKRLENLILS